MNDRQIQSPGRPKGTTTFDRKLAVAFGSIVREKRISIHLSQEDLAYSAQVERSHMGKIERGLHMPNLALILKLSKALSVTPGELVDLAVAQVKKQN